MDGHRFPDSIADSTLEREIERALGVDPSPEFLARVRTRIANEPAPSRWPVSWRFFVTAGAAATLVVGVTVSMWPTSEPVDRPASTPGARVTERRPESPVGGGQASTVQPELAGPNSPARGFARRTVVEPRSRGGRIEAVGNVQVPEVLISADERQAFELVLTIVRQGRTLELPREESRVYREPLSASELRVAPLTEITPVVIEPLPQIARLESGERQ